MTDLELKANVESDLPRSHALEEGPAQRGILDLPTLMMKAFGTADEV
jgi:hypothetical protein